MEARALARLGDAKACDGALAEAVNEFELRMPEDDPEWIHYFDEAELVNLTLAITAINTWNRIAISFRPVPGSYQPSPAA